MSKLREVINDIFYVSKISKTKNKKLLILSSVLLTQIAAYTDIAIIVIFSAVIVDQFTSIELIDEIVSIFVNNIYLLPILVVFRFLLSALSQKNYS